MLSNGFLIFFMQAGFALLEVGSVREQFAQNILLKNLLDATIGTVFWWFFGYAFAFGPVESSINRFIGT